MTKATLTNVEIESLNSLVDINEHQFYNEKAELLGSFMILLKTKRK